MPVLKLFKKSSSKNNASETSPAPDVPADDEKGDSPRAVVTMDGPTPEYSDSLKEAWSASHRELPQARGTDKLLNEIGMSIIPSTSPSRDDRRCVPSIPY